MARFSPLFSSSSGNSYFIGCASGNILVDIGMNAKRTTIALDEIGVDPTSIDAIFITHEHIDHVAGLRVFAAKHKTPIYATAGTLSALDKSGHLAKVENINQIGYGEDVTVGGISISAFETPHDCAQSCGYKIHMPDGRKIGIATDIGCMTDDVRTGLTGCDLIVLESNHDVGMLQNGDYPYQLKRRILSDIGHLSNDSCALELPQFVKNGTTRFILGHLSKENNVPLLAYQTAISALVMSGMREKSDFLLKVADTKNNDPVVVF